MDIDSIFVYGTLKLNHLRSNVWPCAPRQIRQATIRAALYDTGPFPAILQGNDFVLGEVWTLKLEDMPRTLAALDEVEGYAPTRDANLYVRIEVDATLNDGSIVPSFTYQFATSKNQFSMRRIEPFLNFADHSCAAWPDPLSRVPQSMAEEEAGEN